MEIPSQFSLDGGGRLVRRQVVYGDDVAWYKVRDNDLLDIGSEAGAVHGTIVDEWRGKAGQPQRPVKVMDFE